MKKKKRIIIYDETKGKSDNGEMLENLAFLHKIEYVTDVKELYRTLRSRKCNKN